jgi:3-hydroxyisobutyrate dehydrogenase-like beta-hydroxyacid dehydrogenase
MTIDLTVKDLRLIQALAADLGAALPVGDAVSPSTVSRRLTAAGTRTWPRSPASSPGAGDT